MKDKEYKISDHDSSNQKPIKSRPRESYMPEDFVDKYELPKDAKNVKLCAKSNGFWVEWTNKNGETIKYGYGEFD